MIKKLFILVALLVPGFAYAGNPSAPLSVQVVSPGSPSGGLPGSILPPGNWINALDEHFTGTSLNLSVWTLNGAWGGGGFSSYCTNGSTYAVNNGLTIYALPWNSNGSGHGEGCAVSITTSSPYSQTPAYYELYAKTDPGGATVSSFWTFTGPLSSCGGTPAQNGIETDSFEAYNGNPPGIGGVFWDGYASCISTANLCPSCAFNASTAYHLYGIQIESSFVKFYVDGVLDATYTPTASPAGIEPTGGVCPAVGGSGGYQSPYCANGNWLSNVNLSNISCGAGVTYNCGAISGATGFKIAWFRYYHH